MNSLSGPLLLDEGNIASNLNTLIIPDNQISGRIPSNICQLTQLRVLSISDNKITGEIPRNIDCLAKIEVLYIGANAISGTIPASLGNISTLQYVDIPSNRIEGTVPPELGKLSNLRRLNCERNNNLVGQIPKDIFNISSLEKIDFSYNNFSGRIPTTTGLHLPNLEVLYLGVNQLEGEIPEDIFNISSLEIIDFSFNKLSERIPATTGLHLPNLKELHLQVNQLEGEIPLFITNASKLEMLALENNFLTGTIPTNLGNLRKLQELFLHHNQFTNGPREHELVFFNSLVDCRMLRYLLVGTNPLNGVLPSSIGNLSSTIEKFEITNAHITGFIPAGIGNMSGLTGLDFQGNNLIGNIPPEIGKLKQLQGLFLHNNKLLGNIPAFLHTLLDEDMVAHVGDFGISKILAVSKSMAHTETLGTLGYIAPEYGSEGIVSTSGDVYSYGIMLMEVLAKRRPTDDGIFNENLDLREWISRAFPRTFMEVVDADLFPEEEQITSKSEICIASMIELALDCTMEMAESRITMKDVVKRLNKIKNTFLAM